MHDESRILRDRLAALGVDLDAAAPAGVGGAARILLSVFDGGAIPTAADRYFLGHPVALGAAESEGAAPAPAVDAGTVVPFAAIRGVPKAGDLVVATAAGGRWVVDMGSSRVDCRSMLCGATIGIDPPDDPDGDPAEASIEVAEDGTIAGVTLLSGGSDYTAAHPAVGIAGDVDGSGATAAATVGQVTSLSVANAGRGYDPASPPTVTVGAPGEYGEEATVDVTVNPVSGVLSLSLSDGGNLYTVPNPTVAIDPPPAGGTQATATATAVPGVVTELVLTGPGSGFTYPQQPDTLDFTMACDAWSISLPLSLVAAGGNAAPQQPDCGWTGSGRFDFPSSGTCGALSDVLVSVAVGYDAISGVALRVDIELWEDFDSTFECDCFGVPSDVACLTTTDTGSPFGPLAGPEGVPIPVFCTGRPVAWTGSASVDWIGQGDWYVLCGGTCPDTDPADCTQPEITLTFTLTEP
jgi:hypothetical protein